MRAAVVAIILAAGSATRMGQPKQLLDWGGQPLLRAVALGALSSQASAVHVVLGAARDQVAAALAGLGVALVENSDHASGQASSLRVGVRSLPPDAGAALVLLADQPFVTPAIIDALILAWQQSAAPIVAPSYAGRRGNPVLFDRSLFPQLLATQGDQGARSLVQERASNTLLVPFDDARPLEDIDSPEDYRRLLAQK
ncbi:nucleotidyltransferase family protein [Chloroflexia bacterium SDU3-3]|nr:nucleotidyltransferase family protein [Chloroflexia bacterium SDU3-3]